MIIFININLDNLVRNTIRTFSEIYSHSFWSQIQQRLTVHPYHSQKWSSSFPNWFVDYVLVANQIITMDCNHLRVRVYIWGFVHAHACVFEDRMAVFTMTAIYLPALWYYHTSFMGLVTDGNFYSHTWLGTDLRTYKHTQTQRHSWMIDSTRWNAKLWWERKMTMRET